MKEALGRVICPNCGGPPYLDEEKLRFENARLKDEVGNNLGHDFSLKVNQQHLNFTCS